MKIIFSFFLSNLCSVDLSQLYKSYCLAKENLSNTTAQLSMLKKHQTLDCILNYEKYLYFFLEKKEEKCEKLGQKEQEGVSENELLALESEIEELKIHFLRITMDFFLSFETEGMDSFNRRIAFRIKAIEDEENAKEDLRKAKKNFEKYVKFLVQQNQLEEFKCIEREYQEALEGQTQLEKKLADISSKLIKAHAEYYLFCESKRRRDGQLPPLLSLSEEAGKVEILELEQKKAMKNLEKQKEEIKRLKEFLDYIDLIKKTVNFS